MRRKLLSVVLCVCMMMTMAPFAFAEEGDSNEATPTYAPIGTGGSSSSAPSTQTVNSETELKNAIESASSGSTIKLGQDIALTSTLSITKNITLDGDNHTLSGSVTSNTSFINVSIPEDGNFTLTNCIVAPSSNIEPNAAIYLSVAGEVTITNCTFGSPSDTEGFIYNGLEFSQSVAMGNTTITGNTFYGGAFRHNCISFYKMNDNATINISNNNFSNLNWDASNAIRVSNYESNVATINLDGNTYSDHGTASNQSYAGLLLFQNPKNHTDDFTKLTVNISNFSTSSTSQLFYVYDDNTGIITTNQPIIKGDSSIAKFFSARIRDTYYKTLVDAYAALPRGTADTPATEATTITLLKDSAGGGIGSDTDKYMNYVIDFNGHTYTVGAPAVGSTGTVSQGLRVQKTSTAKFMNGTLKAANYQNLIQVVHTYGDVTFQDFTVDATEDSYAWAAVEPDAGTLKILDNSSILARSGEYGLYVAFWHNNEYDGTVVDIDTTGKITGKLAYEFDEDKTGNDVASENKGFVNIKNGYFDVINIQEIWTDVSDTVDKSIGGFSISGGYFTSDPSAYCVEGKTGVATGKADYPYTIGEKKADSQPATVDSATVPAKTTSTDNTVKEVASSISGAAVENNNATEAATKDIANDNKITADTKISTGSQEKTVSAALNDKVSEANKTTDANPVAIVYQTYVDVTVTDAKQSDTSGTTALTELSVELTPMYRVVATTKNVAESTTTEIKLAGDDANAIQIGEPQKLNVPDQEYTIKLALPDNFANANDKLSIKHTKENGSVEYYTGIVSTEGEGDTAKTYVTFTTNGFSPFVISAPVASIDDDVYPSLQAAVDAVQNSQIIKLEKNCDENATVSRAVNFTLNPGGKTFSGTISAGSRYSLTKTNGEDTAINYTVTYVGGSSSSSGTATTTYNVNVNAATNGTVAADKKTAAKGTTVTVTVTPSTGYVVDSVKVVDKDGKDMAVTVKDGKYVFTMPGSAVTVTGTFKAETPAPSGLPFVDVKNGDWFYGAVKYAYENGLMTGTSATTFAPNGTMNRAMIVTVLYRLEKSPAVTGASKFTDVPAGQWYSDAVAWAAANNIVNGYNETTFGPMNAVTREQLAAILFRYEQYKGLENVTLEENLNRFPDHDKVSSYAVPALQWAVGQKIINGNADGTLDPTGTATRAQVAQILTNLLNK